MTKNALFLHVEEMDKSILDPGPDMDQSQNPINWSQCFKWSKKEAGSLPQSEVERCRPEDRGAVAVDKSKSALFPTRCDLAPL